jgi:DNA mismatch endonuclease (patch repair protein)
MERDARQESELRALGWNVITIWECETRDADKILALVGRVRHESVGKHPKLAP